MLKSLSVALLLCLLGFVAKSQQLLGTSPLIQFKGHLYVEAKFAQLDKPVVFLFDTGTDHFIINNDLIQALQLMSLDPLEFTIGTIPFKTAFAPPSNNSQADSLKRMRMGDLLKGKLYGGILGNKAYNDKYAIIDYPKLEFRLYDGVPAAKPFNQILFEPFAYQGDQVFVKTTIKGQPAGYFHLDTGIPDQNIVTFSIAQKLPLDQLGEIPNDSSKTVYEYTYDDLGEPTGRTQRTLGVVNHEQLATASQFSIGRIDLGSQPIRTTNLNIQESVFGDLTLRPISGSLGYETLKHYTIHLDFPGQRIALVK